MNLYCADPGKIDRDNGDKENMTKIKGFWIARCSSHINVNVCGFGWPRRQTQLKNTNQTKKSNNIIHKDSKECIIRCDSNRFSWLVHKVAAICHHQSLKTHRHLNSVAPCVCVYVSFSPRREMMWTIINDMNSFHPSLSLQITIISLYLLSYIFLLSPTLLSVPLCDWPKRCKEQTRRRQHTKVYKSHTPNVE